MSSIGFHANGFVIIDLVPDNELQTGRTIEESILDFIAAERSSLYCERHRCNNESDVLNVLERIKNRLKHSGEIPYIHIEGHGSKEHVTLLNGSLMEWGVIFKHFREINLICKNNLFFSSGACQSAYAFKAASITMACPVFGLLAPEQIVQAGSVSDGFVAFYKALISSGDLNSAFNAFAKKKNGSNYALIFSQVLFEKAARNYIEQHCMGKGLKQRIEKVISEVVNNDIDIPLKKARKLIKQNLGFPQAENIHNFHTKFMMIDLYPDNKDRFIFNAVKFEQEVRRKS